MKTRVAQIFALLEENNIRYYVLRPIDLKENIADLDMIVPREDIAVLKDALLNTYGHFLFRKSHANVSIQIMANDILLDIKYAMCFLPGKSLILNDALSYAGIKMWPDAILAPDVQEEILFTFWTFHLFLDKAAPRYSSTFNIYKRHYEPSKREACLHSGFYKKWTKIIFQEQHQIALKLLEEYFKYELDGNDMRTGEKLKKLIFKARPALRIKFYFDKVKFALYRRLGIYGNYKKKVRIAAS